MSTPSNPSPAALVDALNGVFGQHATKRASHAKGINVSGHFIPDASGTQVIDCPLWQQQQIAIEGRFSIGGGNPKAPDRGQTLRGLSLHIGNNWDLVAISAPVFMVATPAEFVEFLAARRPDPATGKPDPERVKAFNQATPSAMPQINHLAQTPVPASYAQTPYWGVNAFVFTNKAGQSVHGRWHLEPKAGHVGLNADQLAQLDDDFLLPELTQRLQKAPVVFELWLQLAGASDDVTNPTVVWPASNPKVRMGEIVISAMGGSSEATMFNPATLPAGMGLSADPTLQVRAAAYAVSLQRRRAA